jgi:4-amino-4-deoxy-L-arabinose transferase-like glycosyltransferase
VLTAAQHLAGLAVAVLAYALVLRLSGRRALALAAAALIALDAHLIALEHFVMPEAFFALMLMGAFFITVERRESVPWLAVAGVLLAAAVCTRPVALFALPVWLAYLAWTRVPLRALAVAGVALALPLAGYLLVHQHNRGELSFTSASGWLLYGRVGPIVKCGGLDVPPEQRPLCEAEADHGSRDPVEYIFSGDSPAVRLYGGFSADTDEQKRSDGELRDFALRMIRHRPLAYAGMLAGDVGRFMWPGREGAPGQTITVHFPEDAGGVVIYENIRAKYVPGYRFGEDPPASALRAYARVFHTPRWLIGPLLLLALAAVLPWGRSRASDQDGEHRETFLLAGAGLALIVGAAATSTFDIRYLMPAFPLILCGGLIGLGTVLRR